ncbi:MAG: AAA family ATPase [Phycisphaeraceae bacterium]|nr:AAA family ATPase [Phycisphaeraceae bacterium]
MAKRTRKAAVREPDPLPERAVAAGSLESIVGHDEAINFLRDTLRAGRLPHAWMFQGPMGVGKRTLALAYAAALLTPETDPGRQEALDLLAAGAHPDLVLISKELAAYSEDAELRKAKQRNIPLGVLKEFFDTAVARTASLPGGLAAKVCVIDEAHLLAREGQNHLLKTLEEPPPRTVIILVADKPHDLLPTIHSRCQRLRLAPLSSEAMEHWLDTQGVVAADRHVVSRLAEGSPGVADLMLRTGVASWPGRLDPLAHAALTGRDAGELAEACASLAGDWSEAWVKQHPAASKDAANRRAHGLVLSVLGAWVRQLMRDGSVSPAAAEAITRCWGLLDRDVQPRFAYEALGQHLALSALTPAR